MFENGSYLRRRKRFKLFKLPEEDKSVIMKKPTEKTSFFIDNLLANDTSTNTSFTTSSSETNNTLQQLFFTTDFDLVRKLTFFNDVNGHHQQLYW
jgi:hypothetical protein